jgi:hypothetical protein
MDADGTAIICASEHSAADAPMPASCCITFEFALRAGHPNCVRHQVRLRGCGAESLGFDGCVTKCHESTVPAAGCTACIAVLHEAKPDFFSTSGHREAELQAVVAAGCSSCLRLLYEQCSIDNKASYLMTAAVAAAQDSKLLIKVLKLVLTHACEHSSSQELPRTVMLAVARAATQAHNGTPAEHDCTFEWATALIDVFSSVQPEHPHEHYVLRAMVEANCLHGIDWIAQKFYSSDAGARQLREAAQWCIHSDSSTASTLSALLRCGIDSLPTQEDSNSLLHTVAWASMH